MKSINFNNCFHGSIIASNYSDNSFLIIRYLVRMKNIINSQKKCS